MSSFCLKCGENTKSISPLVSKAIHGGTIILSKSAVCNTKKARFLRKKQETKVLLNNLGIRALSSKIPIFRDVLIFVQLRCRFLLAGDNFMPEMHLKQPHFTYRACGSVTKNKERILKFKKPGATKYIYRNDLDKACFPHDMAYGDSRDLAKRTAADKVLTNKAFNIGKDKKYYGYQRGLSSMVYKLFDKKTAGN